MAHIIKRSVVVNFKTYKSGSGKAAELLAKKLAKKGVILAVQNADIYRIAKAVRVPVYGQHVDAAGCGQYTGKDTAETLKYNG
ncbi:MAG: triose-phosphate isomerase, partial [Candidatus Aenigmarchaeota archaeon]|nr:triose-phosphate isomerase [Candidatus Aenigmarchaeota archaeon]